MVPCKRVAQVKNSFVQNFVETHVWTRAHVAPALVRGEAVVTLRNVGCLLTLEESCILKVNVTFSVDFLTLARSLRDLDEARFV